MGVGNAQPMFHGRAAQRTVGMCGAGSRQHGDAQSGDHDLEVGYDVNVTSSRGWWARERRRWEA